MRVLRKCLAGLLAVATAVGCTSTAPNAATPSSEGATTVLVPASIDETTAPTAAPLPEPPAPMVLVGTPQEQVIQLADAFEQRDASRAPALLAAFGAAGLRSSMRTSAR